MSFTPKIRRIRSADFEFAGPLSHAFN